MPSSVHFCTNSDTATFNMEHSIANSSTPFNSASWCVSLPFALRSSILVSMSLEARYVAASPTQQLVAISAIFCRIAPKLEIGVLNCMRSLAYLTDSVMVLRCASKQAAASFIRPTFSAFIAILKPLPLVESMFSTGTTVSLKKT